MKYFTIITSLLVMSITSFGQFNLITPANNTSLTPEGLSATTVIIGWGSQNTLSGSITYTWHLDALSGDFSKPIISVPSNNSGADTNLTLEYGTVNAVLAGAGVPIGTTANLKWTVTASNGMMSTVVSPDTFNINLTRGASISAFDLTFPTNGFSATVEGDDKSKLDITWRSSGEGATYAWFLDLASGNFSSPVVGPLASNNMGMDTVLTLDFATIDAVLAGAGLTNGQTANLKWKVHTYAGTDSIASTSTFTVDLTRGPVIGAFMLSFPTDGFAATIENDSTKELTILWNNAGDGATYKWFLDLATGDYSNAIVAGLASNNMGMDTALTLKYSTIYSVLAGAGVTPGTTANLKWKVHAYAGSDSIASSDFTIDLTAGAGSTSVFNIPKVSDAKVGPNPLRSGEVLSLSTTSKIQSIQIIDVTGKNIELPNLEFGSNELQIETNGFVNGLYFINIITEKSIESRKIIVN